MSARFFYKGHTIHVTPKLPSYEIEITDGEGVKETLTVTPQNCLSVEAGNFAKEWIDNLFGKLVGQ